MKIENSPIFIETSSNFESHKFGIDDLSMIFEILRSKLYSNPIGSIVREISCNARDAHREVGKENIPIEITLPNRLEPSFQVRDFGPGISKERMSNVFVKYTASTKRSDNYQNGGFGLGAKTPFSYTDSFTIITCVNGVKSTYAAYIDETKIGKVDLLSEINTDECNGTRIIVPVKPSDLNYFKDEVMRSLYFWKVKPLLKGISPEPIFNTNAGLDILVSGDGWELWTTNSSYSGNYLSILYDTSSAVILIDDIPYRIRASDLGLNYEASHAPYRNLLDKRLRLYFGIGELTLSANRENIHFDEKTQNIIKDRLKLIVDNICIEAQNKINKCNCLSDAEITLNDLKGIFINVIHGDYEFFWNNIPLKGIIINKIQSTSQCKIIKFSNFTSKIGNVKLNQEKRNILTISNKSPIYIHDLDGDNMPIKRIKKLLNDNKSIESIQLIKFYDDSIIQDWNNTFNFNLLTTYKTSTLPIPEKIKRVKNATASSSHSEIYLFNKSSYKNSEMWLPSSFKEIMDKSLDKDDSIIYVILKDKRTGEWETSNEINENVRTKGLLTSIEDVFDKSIVAIRKKDLTKIDRTIFISLGQFVSEEFGRLSHEHNLSDICSVNNAMEYAFDRKYYEINTFINNNLEKIKNKESISLKYFNQTINIKNKYNSYEYSGDLGDPKNKIKKEIGFLKFCHREIFKYKINIEDRKHDIINTYLEFKSKYPMINYLERYSYFENNERENYVNNIINYINIMDSAI